jgi:hypothetical protein
MASFRCVLDLQACLSVLVGLAGPMTLMDPLRRYESRSEGGAGCLAIWDERSLIHVGTVNRPGKCPFKFEPSGDV